MHGSLILTKQLLLITFTVSFALHAGSMRPPSSFLATAFQAHRQKRYRRPLLSGPFWKHPRRFHAHKHLANSLISVSKLSASSRPEEFDVLMEQIRHLNGGEGINVNSPKQVSSAIFGDVRSTSKNVLKKAAEGEFSELPLQKTQLASLVLQCREISRENPSAIGTAAEQLPDASIDNSTTVARTTTTDENTNSSFERHLEFLFDGTSSKLNGFWRQSLEQLSRPSARSLVWQLDSRICPMGYDPLAQPFDPLRSSSSARGNTGTTTAGKKGSFLAYCREQKVKYPDCIILTRCGDFYETFGVDAIMLVEHCGLNAMAGKAKAGCPIRNVQATLDCLTSQGFRVAVYEEGTDTDASTGAGASAGAKSRIKSRFLAQIVSAASPTYLYDLVLLSNADMLVTAPPSRPYLGILSLAAGYTLVEVSTEARSVRVSERLTAEAVACRVAANPPADPLFYVPSHSEYESTDGSFSLPFLPSGRESSSGSTPRFRTRIIPPSLVPEPENGVNDLDRAKNTIVSALLQAIECKEDDASGQRQRARVSDFTLVLHEEQRGALTATNPLYVETATQLGLMNDPVIPSLVSYLLPESAPAATKRFLRRYLLSPPPPTVADAMRYVVSFLREDSRALPPLSIPPLGKVLALLRAGQASAQVFGELLQALHSTKQILEVYSEEHALVQSLMVLLEYESGLAAEQRSLRKRCEEAIDTIEAVVSHIHHTQTSYHSFSERETISDYNDVVPRAFFDRNEASWRGRVREDAVSESYERVRESANKLAKAVANDFWGVSLEELQREQSGGDISSKSPIVQDIFNNIIALKDIPSWCADKNHYYHPRDRNGKVLKNRYTTDTVQSALSQYVTACEQACQDVATALMRLSEELFNKGHIPAVVQASHSNLVLSSAFHHATQANRMDWGLPSVFELDDNPDDDCAGKFLDVWPYWIDKTEAVRNSFDLSGMWLLTAPNMAGKSTIMRSTAAAALLGVCGLCAPLSDGSRVRRFDNIFVRGASADVPSEQKSAFGAEMGDIAALLRSCGQKSLVFVDELGRGTSPRDGTRLAGAVLEEMALKRMNGVFATHLHDIFKLPLEARERIFNKRMAIHDRKEDGSEVSRYSWTYRLEDGICVDSMAILTAERFGLPQNVIERAKELDAYLDSSNTQEIASEQAHTHTTSARQETKKSPRLVEIAQSAEKLIGRNSIPVPPQWNCPASLDGTSCLYILELEGEPPQFYVGESDCVRKRIEQHRKKKGRWLNSSAVVFPLEGKSQARAFESRVIQKLAKNGVPLYSTTDGRSIRRENTS